jgi:uncharacterized protein YceK
MTRPGVGAILAIALVGLSGCGTVWNLQEQELLTLGPPEHPKQIYGGVKADAHLSYCVVDAFTEENPMLPRSMIFALGLGALLDLPLSAVGDTATLPWTFLPTIGP